MKKDTEKKATTLEEVQARMKEMQEKKAAELQKIQAKKTEAQLRKDEAEQAIKDATEIMDLEAFEAAKEAKHKAQIAIEMYAGRYEQLRKQEYISEEESDKVIDSLLEYENEITGNFKAAMVEPIKALADILASYLCEVESTENTIRAWETNIHANYESRGATFYVDPETGEKTTRSKTPIRVHFAPYTGCNEATRLKNYLKGEKNILGV